MPTLYYSPGACSLSPRIALLESGLKFDAEKVDLKTKKTASGEDYTKINPNGYVPALKLDNGQVITEGPAIIQYVADQAPDKKLAPANGSHERYTLASLLNFITAELHKQISVLFGQAPDDYKQSIREKITKRLASLEPTLGKHPYLLGDHFTVADGYLFWNVRTWLHLGGKDLGPNLKAWLDRVNERNAVKQAVAAEV